MSGFRQTITLIAALGMATAAPALAQAPDLTGALALAGKSDSLKDATGRDQIEAALATCLALGANPKVVQMVFTEAGWTRIEEASDDYAVFLQPASGPEGLYAQIGTEAMTCGIGSTALGGAAAHELVKSLIGTLNPAFNTVTEGEGADSCTRYDLAVQGVVNAQVYASVFDDLGDEMSCDLTATNSLTTFAFVTE